MLKKRCNPQKNTRKEHAEKQSGKVAGLSALTNVKEDSVTLTTSQLRAILAAFNVDGDVAEEKETITTVNSKADEFQNEVHSQEAKPKLHSPEPIEPNTLKTSSLDRKQLPRTPPSPGLSKLEQKKIQWQKDREEFAEWNPWGKPGAGAPMKQFSSSTGNLIHLRGQSPSWSHTDSEGSRFGTPTTAVARALPKNITKSAPPMKYVPMAIASSVPLGDNDEAAKLELYKREEKKRWLLDLERQREEQRSRKGNQSTIGRTFPSTDHDLDLKSSLPENGAVNIKTSHNLCGVDSNPSAQVILSDVTENHLKKLNLNENINTDLYVPCTSSSENLSNYINIQNVSSSVSNCQSPSNEERGLLFHSSDSSSDGIFHSASNKENQRSFLRGQNVPIDDSTKAQLEEKKLKALKLQHEIQAQIEEKAKLKHEEKIRIQNEEIEEEKRLIEQQLSLQRQYELEQQRIKEKEIAEEEKRLKIVAEIEKAQKEAENEKRWKRKCLTPIEAGVVTNDGPPSPAPVKHLEMEKTPDPLPDVKRYEVSTSMEKDVRNEPPDLIYVTNRLLTPSQYRQSNSKDRAECREFGTQTEVTTLKEIDKKPHPRRHKPKQVTKDSRSSSISNSERLSESERPKWGVNKPRSSYLKQSEKDPHYEKRKPKSKVPADSDSSTTPVSSETRNLVGIDTRPKTLSVDSGYEERNSQTNRMHYDKADTNDGVGNPTIPVIRSHALLNQSDSRQDRILQQLSDLRQGLLQKQIELQKLISAAKTS